MLLARLQNVVDILSKNGLDALVISNPSDILYLTGLNNHDCALIITTEKYFLITDSRYILDAYSVSDIYRVVEHNLGLMSGLKALIQKLSCTNVGVQDEYLTLCDYATLTNGCDCAFLGIASSIENIRSQKSNEEIENIISAQKITDAAFEYLLDYIKPGLTEKEIAFELEMFVRKNGAERLSFDPIVASGPNSAKPHAIPSDRRLLNGDILTLDFGCVVNGYCSDMTRTVSIGKPSDEFVKIYNIVLNAHNIAKNGLAPGIATKHIDALAREYISHCGYGNFFGHGLGHGVGIDIHEQPMLSYRSDEVLKKGNVVTVEPGIYIPNVGGVRIENMCYITDDGYYDITKSDNKLIII